jgi:hypothetical protein
MPGTLAPEPWASTVVALRGRSVVVAQHPAEALFVGCNSDDGGTTGPGLDEVPNWSALSNVVRVSVLDLIPPGGVTDLAVRSSAKTTVTLTWTAPGNDGTEGRAVEYDVRYGDAAITGESWSTAQRVEGVSAPSAAWTTDSLMVTGLEEATTYYFALKTRDQVPNWSALSNVIETMTSSSSTLQRLTSSPEGTYAVSPCWSPDGQEIAFWATWNGDYEIYRVPSAGGTATRLTSDPAMDCYPAWSPDGTRIAFYSDRGG